MYLELLFVLAFASVAAAANTTRCFECTDVPDPYDCLETTTCAPEQICVVEQFITSGGLVLYNSGCQSRQRCSQSGKRNVRQYSTLSKRADIITCDECCSTDFCNDQGCGKAAPKQPARGPTCFACDVESDPKSCRTIAHCDFGKVCMLSETSHTGDGHHTYRTTCVTPQVCDAFLIIGRKRYNNCHVCCHDDFCNDVCEASVTPVHTTPVPTTPTPMTPAPTIPTVPTTTIAPTTTTMPTTTEQPTTATPTPTTTTIKTTTTERTTTTEKPTTQVPVTTTKHTHGHVCHTHAGYKYDHDSQLCYKFHYEHKNWDDANAVCKTEGGTLAIVDTQDKWTFLKAQIENDLHLVRQWIYIGGRNHPYPGSIFYWPNEYRVQFNAWAPMQPEAFDWQQACMGVAPAEDHYLWHDFSCTERIPYICTIHV